MSFVRRLGYFALPVLSLLVTTAVPVGRAASLETRQAAAAPQGPAGTAFTYQGQLNSAGAPVNASCDFQFSLWDDAAAGAQAGATLAPTLSVVDGLFTTTLDFGDQFIGDERWLEIAVQCPGDPGLTVLSPRVAMLGVPYANGLRPGINVADSATGSSAAIAVPLYGLYGFSTGAAGVAGSSTNGAGIAGEAQASFQPGVSGTNSAVNGIGVRGEANASGGAGVYGVGVGGVGVAGNSTGGSGVFGTSTNGTGVYGTSTTNNGVIGQTSAAFRYGVYGVNNGASNGIGVRGEAHAAGGVGVWGQSNANTGVYGLSTDGAAVWGQSTNGVGVRAESTNNAGLYVASAGDAGVLVNSATWQGVRVGSAGYTGVWVNAAGNNGFWVSSAGGNGVYVESAGGNGVYANTTQASGQWGLYTPDRIFGTVGMFSAVSIVAQVGGPESLTPGDLVAVAGVADPLPGSTAAMPLVRLADGASAGIVGVVEHRLAMTPQPSRPAAEGGEASTEPTLELRNADGPAQAGDYVAIIVLGAAQAKVAPGESAIAAGTRLTASADGAVRPLQTRTVDGMVVAEGAPVAGVALAPAKDGTVWVLVNPQ